MIKDFSWSEAMTMGHPESFLNDHGRKHSVKMEFDGIYFFNKYLE